MFEDKGQHYGDGYGQRKKNIELFTYITAASKSRIAEWLEKTVNCKDLNCPPFFSGLPPLLLIIFMM